MITIDPSNPGVTLINVFDVEPERSKELADILSTATDTVIQHLPGFKSASIHHSEDGTRVVNYAQWESAETYHTMLQNPQAQEHMKTAAELANSFSPLLYTVESVHEASQ